MRRHLWFTPFFHGGCLSAFLNFLYLQLEVKIKRYVNGLSLRLISGCSETNKCALLVTFKACWEMGNRNLFWEIEKKTMTLSFIINKCVIKTLLYINVNAHLQLLKRLCIPSLISLHASSIAEWTLSSWSSYKVTC